MALFPLAERTTGSGYHLAPMTTAPTWWKHPILMQGLITAKAVFDGSDAAETTFVQISIHFIQ